MTTASSDKSRRKGKRRNVRLGGHLTPKQDVQRIHRNAYSRWIVMSGAESTPVAVITIGGEGRDIGVGFSATEAWADALRRMDK